MITPNKSLPVPTEGESKIDLFERKEIRKTLHGKEWWFSVKDIVEAIVETKDGNDYVRQLKNRDPGLEAGWRQIVVTLPFQSVSGVQNTNFISIEGIFRLIQSIPTKKADPFKRWLARVGFERLQEIENPELAIQRAITIYRSKGYTDEWIDARIRNKASRELLTSVWEKVGMKNWIGLLTDSISVETFGIGTTAHKALKGLKASHSLRDNMTPIELTLTTLGEQATTEIVKKDNPTTLEQNKFVAKKGGRVAGVARRAIEEATGEKVVSATNYLTDRQRKDNTQIGSKQDLNSILDKFLELPDKSS